MHRPSFFISVLPVTLGSASIIGFFGVLTLLFFPETVMRNALDVTITEVPKPVYATLQEAFIDEILDEAGATLSVNDVFQPIGLTGAFAVGDRLTVRRGEESGFRSFVVTDVRRIGDLTTKVNYKDKRRTWVLVIAKDVAYSDGPIYRFIVEESNPITLQLKSNNSQAL